MQRLCVPRNIYIYILKFTIYEKKLVITLNYESQKINTY